MQRSLKTPNLGLGQRQTVTQTGISHDCRGWPGWDSPTTLQGQHRMPCIFPVWVHVGFTAQPPCSAMPCQWQRLRERGGRGRVADCTFALRFAAAFLPICPSRCSVGPLTGMPALAREGCIAGKSRPPHAGLLGDGLPVVVNEDVSVLSDTGSEKRVAWLDDAQEQRPTKRVRQVASPATTRSGAGR